MEGDVKGFEYQSVLTLKGVGPGIAEKLKRLQIYSLQDVLFHLPLRYEDRTRVIPLGALQPGQQVLVEGVVEHSEIKYGGRSRRSLRCHFSDHSGAIVLRFFHFNKSQQQMLINGSRLRCFGEIRYGAHQLEMIHPEFQRISDCISHVEKDTLTPVYPKTEGVHQTLLRKISVQVLEQMDHPSMTDWLPESIRKNCLFPDLCESLRQVHWPHKSSDIHALLNLKTRAQQRLIFEELLAHQLSLLKIREQIRRQQAVALPLHKKTLQAFTRQFGFSLTSAQEKVADEILNDIRDNRPMLRLLQGDVGSGKTVVAAIAALAAADNHFQVAIMVPTEILAEQHLASFQRWFSIIRTVVSC